MLVRGKPVLRPLPRRRGGRGPDNCDAVAQGDELQMTQGGATENAKSSVRYERWDFDLIDLTRVLTEETTYALLGDIAAGEENRHYSQISVTYDREWATSNGTLCHL